MAICLPRRKRPPKFVCAPRLNRAVGEYLSLEAEAEELVDAFMEAMDGGPSLWRGRRLRLDDIHAMPEEWDQLWEYSSDR